MKKEVILIVIGLIIVLSAIEVYAIGNSGNAPANNPFANAANGAQNNQNQNNPVIDIFGNATNYSASVQECEAKTTIKERVKCRLEKRIKYAQGNQIHESCRAFGAARLRLDPDTTATGRRWPSASLPRLSAKVDTDFRSC